MRTMEILFLVFTIPGIYLAVMLGVYKLYKKFIFDDDIEEARVAAFFWIITLPFFTIIGGGYWIFSSLFDMIDGGDKNDNDH